MSSDKMFSKRISRLSDSLIREVIEASRRPGMISFAGGMPANEAMAELDWSAMPSSLAQYGFAEGEPDLRKAISGYLNGIGLDSSDKQVLILSGSQQGIDLAARLFVDEGTCVLAEAPTYSAALQNFGLFGARYAALPLHPDGLDPAQFEAAIIRDRPACAYLMPSFQNPTGTCYSNDVRREIAAICDRHQLPVVEDDAYRELSYGNAERTPVAAFLKKAPWIYLGTFSKTVAPGIRLGYLASSEHLFPLLLQLKHSTDLMSNRFAQWVLHRYISGPSFQPHLQQLRALYGPKRDCMDAALQKHLADAADWNTPQGGLFFWLRLKREFDLMTLLTKALDAGVAFMPGTPFFPEPSENQPSCIRLNFSHVPADKIDLGLEKLGKILREN